MNRKPIVAGNWKMNNSLGEGIDLVAGIIQKLENTDEVPCEIILAPSYLHLHSAAEMTEEFEDIQIASQDVSRYEKGAFTGDVSAAMVASTGAKHTLIGHSERRIVFKDDSDSLLEKLRHAVAAGLNVIYCVGEELSERYDNAQEKVVSDQLNEVIFNLPLSEFKNVVIAYEPVWAIGTGETATPEQAQEMHRFIREKIAVKYGRDIANATRILYGGSCKPNNAKELFSQPDIDGGLIGGASLSADDFFQIIEASAQ
jgi:triosephosphate isomerase